MKLTILILLTLSQLASSQTLREVEEFHAKMFELSIDKELVFSYTGILSRTSQKSGNLIESNGVWLLGNSVGKYVNMVSVETENVKPNEKEVFVYTAQKAALHFKFYELGNPEKPLTSKGLKAIIGLSFEDLSNNLDNYKNRFQDSSKVYGK